MSDAPSIDRGFTHIALVCTDAEATIEFYQRYAGFRVIHDRTDDGTRVFWLSDLRRPFAIVFLEAAEPEAPLGPFAHLGVCVESRAEVDRLVGLAKGEGRTVAGPNDYGPPVGYWAFIQDPDGHNLELSYGQTVELAVAGAAEKT
ncbi:MAG: VOC family protein [Pseudomonadota bacterium]